MRRYGKGPEDNTILAILLLICMFQASPPALLPLKSYVWLPIEISEHVSALRYHLSHSVIRSLLQ